MISHDRDLLNKAVNSIAHLEHRKLTFYKGNYDTFEETRRMQMELNNKSREKTLDQIAHLQKFVDRFKAKATKAKQAQSRVKALAKMQPIAAQVEDRVIPFSLPNPQKLLASPLLRMESASAGYAADSPILTGLNLRIDQDDRIALLGQNGNGKSTFAKLLAGKLEPLSGKVYGANRVEAGYFAQHQLDELNPLATPYDHIAKLMLEATEAQKRTRLGTFGFSADKADTRCANLSGGEKARLLLALTAFHGPHLLILDEPTNHLDVDSREALVHALTEFEGAVILISHDRHLVEATADRLWIVRGGTVTPYDGDMDSYRTELLAERGTRQRGERTSQGEAEARVDRAAQRRLAAGRRSELAPLKKAMQAAEKAIEKLTADIAKLDAALADPALYAMADKAQKTALERGQLAKRLSEAEEAWLEATSVYETAAAFADVETA
jgi:ATP-binding cassette subfamily F protein 3